MVPVAPSPLGYVCYRSAAAPRIDGRLDDPAWQEAAWTADFVDIEGDARPRPALVTRARMLWDDQYFYVGAELREPHLWATLTEHDSVIFQDDDFEVFIDPNGDNHEYYEFEINALGTGWDLLLTRPYKDGGKAVNGWEVAGLKAAVHLDGTLNDPTDTDGGWSVEIAAPPPDVIFKDGFDTTAECGNAILETGEDCDGSDLGGQSCPSLGFMFGTLACTPACTFDTSACSNCGNGTIETGEACDGANLAGQTSQSQGYASGSLSCEVDCASFDTSGCVPF
jgi:hypothetical protein